MPNSNRRALGFSGFLPCEARNRVTQVVDFGILWYIRVQQRLANRRMLVKSWSDYVHETVYAAVDDSHVSPYARARLMDSTIMLRTQSSVNSET